MKVLAKLDNAKLALYGLSYWVYVEKLCYVVKILTVFVKFFPCRHLFWARHYLHRKFCHLCVCSQYSFHRRYVYNVVWHCKEGRNSFRYCIS